MRLHIRRRGVEVNEELRLHVKDRLRTALGRFAHYVSEVWVYLRDINRPCSGFGAKCRIVVFLPFAGRVIVVGTDAEPFAAVKRTADRVRVAVRRRIKRRLARRRRPAAAHRAATRVE